MVVLVVCLSVVLSACSKSLPERIIGYYTGDGRSEITFYDNGTCMYDHPKFSQPSRGSWTIVDDKVIVKGIFTYDIYADVSNFNDRTLFFQSESSRWNDELFTKQSDA